MIFAKTEFEGVVKASYIKLSIIDQKDPAKTYDLVIGDKTRQQEFPWNSETVRPDYFFIELPMGSYRIRSLSIPVGSTMATEDMDVAFEVRPEKIIYLGTLKVTGTKETVKLGGVPVLKPGFEYTIHILNEQPEAFNEFYKRFPNLPRSLDVQLMKDLRQANPPGEDPHPPAGEPGQ
ncbi:MAG: hypothetical protein U1D99_08200 [Candidatus Omnitrophota bacterium]|nr:hypothetical protein [Candidatus Omnitrophota bacterium]